MRKILGIIVLSFLFNVNTNAEITKLICSDPTERDFLVQIPDEGIIAQIQGQIVGLKRSEDQYILEYYGKEGVINNIFFSINRSTGRFEGLWQIAANKGFYSGYCKLKPKNKF